VAAPDQRSAARPENELGSRLRLVWWPASASTTPQGRLQSGSPPPADETTGAQSTMKLKRLALTLSCRGARGKTKASLDYRGEVLAEVLGRTVTRLHTGRSQGESAGDFLSRRWETL